jgi:hypothetical protein
MTTSDVSLLSQRIAVLEATMKSEHEIRIACLADRKAREEQFQSNLSLFASNHTVSSLSKDIADTKRELWHEVAKLQVAAAINKTNLVILMGIGSFVGCSIGAVVISWIFRR